MACRGKKQDGSPCKAPVRAGETWCVWHDPSPEGRARHLEQSKRGGQAKAYGAIETLPALAEEDVVPTLDLDRLIDVQTLLSVVLLRLTQLRFDVRVANAITQAIATYRSIEEDRKAPSSAPTKEPWDR